MTALTFDRQKKLDFWLEHDPDRFEKYLIAHPEVGEAYESLHTLSATVRSALSEAVDVPIDLVARLLDRTAERSDTGAFAVSLDMLSVGFTTAMGLFFNAD
jgi:hypothetical protein